MAKADRKIDLLRGVSLFRLCTDKELKDVASLLDEATLKEGTVLIKEGAVGEEAYIVAAGTADVTLRGEKLGAIGPGDAVGEMALLDVSPRSATVTATSEMQVFILEPRSFGELLMRHPSVSKLMMAALARRLRELEQAPTY